MCCAWQTHLGTERKIFAKSSNRNLQIQQLLSSLVQGFWELDHRVFVGEGTWASVLWFGYWKEHFCNVNLWTCGCVQFSIDHSVSTLPADKKEKSGCDATNDQFQEKLLWNADSPWVMMIKPRLVAGQQIEIKWRIIVLAHEETHIHTHFKMLLRAYILQTSIHSKQCKVWQLGIL